MQSALLRVPSVIVPHSYNYLLNPRHELASSAKILSCQDHPFDHPTTRDKTWTESLAVGSEAFVEKAQTLLAAKATNRKVVAIVDKHALREQSARYNIVSGAENSGLSLDSRFLRGDLYAKSMSYSGPTRYNGSKITE